MESENCPGFSASWKAGHPVKVNSLQTLADGQEIELLCCAATHFIELSLQRWLQVWLFPWSALMLLPLHSHLWIKSLLSGRNCACSVGIYGMNA